MSPGPLFRWTSIAAPITSLLRRSAFSYNGCISERIFTEDSEGNKGWNWVCNLFAIFASFCWILRLSERILPEDSEGKQRLKLVRNPFVIFVSFCLVFSAALLRIGWEIEREFRGSDRILSRPSWSDVVFAFDDREEIGPKMLARIAKRTGSNRGSALRVKRWTFSRTNKSPAGRFWRGFELILN